jgi:Rrf2 family iron-sulfur cluster assembly transcriptional regulator
MRLTTKGQYAINGLLDLVRNGNGQAVRLEDIARRQGISLHYLEQLFRKMRLQKIVRSLRGPGGGYVLTKPANQISLKSVISSVGEPLGQTVATHGATPETAMLQVWLGEFNTVMNNHLDTKTIQDLL